MEVCGVDAGSTQSVIAPPDPPSIGNNHETKTTSNDEVTVPEGKGTLHRLKTHGGKSILEKIVLTKLNKKNDAALCRATGRYVEERDGMKKEIGNAFEGSLVTKQYGAKKCGITNSCERKNKRKRSKNSQSLLWKADGLQNFKVERTDDMEPREERHASSKKVTVINYEGIIDEQSSADEEQEINAEKGGESSKAPQESPLIGGRFQALNATKQRVFKTSGKLFGMMSKMGDRKRHVCNECGRCFNQVRVLAIHQQMHTVKRTPSCTYDEQSSREQTLQVPEHRERGEPCLRVDAESANEKGEPCLRVDAESANEKGEPCLRVDAESADEEKEFMCVIEEKDVTQSRNYLQEVSEQHVKGANHVRAKKRRKLDHDGSCSDKKGYSCDACGKVFSLPSFLRRHQIVHTGERAFACRFCGKRFGQKATCQRHEQTHQRNGPHMCNECGDGFSSSNRLKRHVKEKHKASNEKSDQPGDRFSLKLPKDEPDNTTHNKNEQSESADCSNEQLRTGEVDKSGVHAEIHMETLSLPQTKEPKIFTCLVCEKTFLQRSHLLRHSLSHTGEKPFKCKECGKGFTQKSTCQRHERTHSGELLFICTECGNSFAQKSGLQKHKLIHTGEKPYGCRFCDCRFTQKTTCQRHERIHTGEKPYVCQQCGKAFGQSTSLERHIKTHARLEPSLEEKKG